MPEIPVFDPLIKTGVLDMPTGTDDLQRRSAGELTRSLADDGEAPCPGWFFVRFGDHSANHPDFSFVAIEGLDVVAVPKLQVLFFVRVLVLLTGPLLLP
jgi:hypothetical protein